MLILRLSCNDIIAVRDTVSLSVSERSLKKRDPSLWPSPEKFVVLGDHDIVIVHICIL